MHGIRRFGGALGAAAVVLTFGMAHDATAESGAFESTWDIKGSSRQLEFGPRRLLSTVRHTGTITFRSSTGLVGTVMTSCVGLGDTAKPDIGRCIWTTQNGEKLFSELTGTLPPGLQTGSATGAFVGGTGRFAGVTGTYSLEWVARPIMEKDAFGAQTVRMSGNWQTP
jgi:hypothetical protein